MSIQAGIQELLRRLTSLEAWRKQAPSFGWGYVVQTDPLQVRREFDADPLPGKPGSAGGTHHVGDRVLLLEQGSRVTVMTSKPPTPTRRGTIAVATGALTQIGTTGIWATTVNVAGIPTSLAAGERLVLRADTTGTGFGSVAQPFAIVGPLPAPISTTVRFTQVGSSNQQTLSLVWEIVPTSSP